MFRFAEGTPEVLLVHPGGPFWRNKDEGAWSIPKGLIARGESPLVAARREFAEETGFVPRGDCVSLGEFRQPSRKMVAAFAMEGDLDARALKSNLFEIEWPPLSGKVAAFPEVDRADWFDLTTAREKINPGQKPILDALAAYLASAPGPRSGS